MWVIIGDEHCRGKFSTICEQVKEDKSIDHIVCLGDYFSPYISVDWEKQKENFLNIIEIANKDSRIELLLGNHDLMYLFDADHSRYDYKHAGEIKRLIKDNLTKFNLIIKPNEDTLISHAGVSSIWLEYRWQKAFSEVYGKESENYVSEINDTLIKLISEDPTAYEKALSVLRSTFTFTRVSWDLCGEAEDNSPTWVRPNGLLKSGFPGGIKTQIVGHTKTTHLFQFFNTIAEQIKSEEDLKEFSKPTEVTKDGLKVICCDTDDYNTYWKGEL